MSSVRQKMAAVQKASQQEQKKKLRLGIEEKVTAVPAETCLVDMNK